MLIFAAQAAYQRWKRDLDLKMKLKIIVKNRNTNTALSYQTIQLVDLHKKFCIPFIMIKLSGGIQKLFRRLLSS